MLILVPGLWDTAGQEVWIRCIFISFFLYYDDGHADSILIQDYDKVRQASYGSSGEVDLALVLFSVVNPASFENLRGKVRYTLD